MAASDASFVDPSNLALPSPSRTPESSTSSLPPSSSSKPPAKSRPAPTTGDDNTAPRKRARSDLTQEERREARAHRNRIAAQNSRDKRKAQFSALEARIGELEAENRALRVGMAHPHPSTDNAEQRAANAAREAENSALRERVRVLETGWEAIVRALQTHGVAAGLPSLLVPPPAETNAPSPSSAASSPSPPPSTTTFPVLVPPTPTFPLDPTAFPLSPAPSYSSAVSSITGGELRPSDGVPAAGGPTQTDEDLGALFGTAGTDEVVDEAAMDDLFREILAPSPAPSSTTPSLMGGEGEIPGLDLDQGWAGAGTDAAAATKEAEREMQRLLDLMPVDGTALGLTIDGASLLPIDNDCGSGAAALELDLGAWETSLGLAQPVF
ncbi:hypothetical protein BC834DRAFT_1040820 [Gloeopeniophorella convolvens]|nr:hypothetical protein BC834DRAFT_1040820 [Gloeopeniophorella convolvens]